MLVCRFWLVCILFAISVTEAFGWGPQGHRVIGYIAEFHLTPEIKKLIVDEFSINNLANVAIWADNVRKKRKQENPWHYANVKEEEWFYVAKRDCPDGNCVTEKIKEFSGVLSNKENPFKKRQDALKYLVHFVGDVHQPLHLGNLRDRGGGKIILNYFGKDANLHYLWDGGLIDWDKGSLLEYAKRLNNRLDDTEQANWVRSKVDDWANESRELALKFAYRLEKDSSLSKAYISKGREILDQRMVQAGIRLAKLLNILLKSEN